MQATADGLHPIGSTVTVRRYCQRCQKMSRVNLVRNITQSGVSQVYWYCIAGEHAITKTGIHWIEHQKVREAGIDINNLPIIVDYGGNHVCVVCGSKYVEYHHWAPRHLFGDDADRWPTAWLCKDCHDRWHTLVTPNMCEVRNGRS